MNESLLVSSGRGGQAEGKSPVADLRSQFASAENAAGPSVVSYASVTTANPDASPRSQAPRSGSIFSGVPKAKYNTRSAIIPAAELPQSFHHDRTYLLRLSGPTAPRVTSRDICIALVSEGAMSLDEWEEYTVYYRYESPFERYLHIQEGAQFTLTHNSTYVFKPASVGNSGPDVEIRIEDLSVKETTFFLEWVPATYSGQLVEKMLLSVGLQPTSLRRDNRSVDKWVVTTSQHPSEVPHYIVTPHFTNDGRNNKRAKILVTIPRRWTECQYCRSTTHRSHKCQNKGKNITVPYIDLTKQREQYPPEFFDLQPQPKRSTEWKVPKSRGRPRKESIKTAPADVVELSNRFMFPSLLGLDDLDSTAETVDGDHHDMSSITSTPKSVTRRSSQLFHKPAQGTFNFNQGQISAPKVSLKKKKAEGQTKNATPAKKTPQRRGDNQVPVDSSATPKRPLRPRQPTSSPGSQKIDYFGRKQKHVKLTANGKNENSNVSELAAGGAEPDNASGPSGGEPGVGDVVPSSAPVADAALGDGDRSLSFPTLTGSLFDEDGDVDRGKPPDVDSQCVESIKSSHDIVPLP